MPDLEFPRSDGDKAAVPHSEQKTDKVPLSDDRSIAWRKKIGTEIAVALELESNAYFLDSMIYSDNEGHRAAVIYYTQLSGELYSV